MNDRQRAAKWAYDLLRRNDWCVIDTETTGFAGNAEIVQLAIVSRDETVLFETLVKPTVAVDQGARNVHKITDEALAVAPKFDSVAPKALEAIAKRDVVIYNASFDLRILRQSAKPYNLPSDLFSFANVHCAMKWYSKWMGERKNQKLPGGDHSAAGDCRAVIQVMRQMAESWKPGRDEVTSEMIQESWQYFNSPN